MPLDVVKNCVARKQRIFFTVSTLFINVNKRPLYIFYAKMGKSVNLVFFANELLKLHYNCIIIPSFLVEAFKNNGKNDKPRMVINIFLNVQIITIRIIKR